MKLGNQFTKFFNANKFWMVALFYWGAITMILVGMDYSHTLYDDYRDGKVRYLLMFASVYITIYLWKINPYWAAFAGYSFFRWVLDDFSGYGVADVILIVACLVIGNTMAKMERFRFAAGFVTFLAVIQAAYGLMQYCGLELFQSDLGERFYRIPIGTMGNETILGPFLVLGVLHLWTRKMTILNFCLITMMNVSIMACGSSMTIVAYLFGILYLVYRYNHEFAKILGIAVFVFLGTIYQIYPNIEAWSFTGRLAVWPHGLQDWLSRPMIGHGPGAWLGYLSGPVKSELGMYWNQLHNEYLQVLVEQGVVGLMIVLAGLYSFFKKAFTQDRLAGAWGLALCANSLANFPMHIATFGVIAGFLAATVHQEKAGE